MIELSQLDSLQREVVDRCCEFSLANQIFCVSGGAGTGKTTLLQHAYMIAQDLGHTPLLCAPTGKAARRIREATGIAAVTIHAALEFPKPGERDEKTGKALMQPLPKRTARYPLEQNVVFVDEGSMLNLELMHFLKEAMPKKGGYLRLFGDHNQLPPIEQNGAEKRSDYIPAFMQHWQKNGVHLERIYRQAEGSGILFNASRILQGYQPLPKDDFKMIACFSQIEHIANIARHDTDKVYAGQTGQIITPQNRGALGTHALNMKLQAIYNPEPAERAILERHPYHPLKDVGLTVGIGDKVIMTANWYLIEPSGVMNGDIGIIEDIQADGTLIIDFKYDNVVAVPPVMTGTNRRGDEVPVFPQKDLELAYAITTHKAQGSEYDRVVYTLDRSHAYMMCRSNFYTAVTRARKHVDVVFKGEVMRMALSKEPLSKKAKK